VSGSGYLITGRIKDQIHNQMISTPARHRPSETRLIRNRQAYFSGQPGAVR